MDGWMMTDGWQRMGVGWRGCGAIWVGNPAFREHISYSCQKVFADKEGKNRIFDEMWTGDWWWKTQVRSPKWNKANLTYLLDPAKTPQWCGRGASYSCIR